MPFQFLRRLLGRSRDESHHEEVIQIFTPTAAAGRSVGTRIALAGATIAGLAFAGALAVGALVVLFLAIGAIYLLLTRVLGIRLDLDPRAFVERAQQYAAAAGRN